MLLLVHRLPFHLLRLLDILWFYSSVTKNHLSEEG